MESTSASMPVAAAAPETRASKGAYLLCALVGLGGLFAGVTGPLLSTYVPILVRDALGEHRAAIGAVMAIDNVLLFVLVPWAGILSDRASHRGASRLPLVIAGYALAAAGMAMFPTFAGFGLVGVVATILVLYGGLNIQRSPFQALMADLVPSRQRSMASASVMFQQCVGAIVFLMLGRLLGMRPAFLVAAVTVLAIAGVFAMTLRQAGPSETQATEATLRSMVDAAAAAVRGVFPGLRAIFLATLFLQTVFQAFATWFALHGTERFGVTPEDVTIGFIAWAVGGVFGALPAGFVGLRIGRRKAMLVGFALMVCCFVALDRVTTLGQAIPLLMLASASWTFPSVNAYPLFIEQIPRHRRGVLASLYLLCMALGGAVGDPLNGTIFDLANGYRPLFLVMAAYTTLAFLSVLLIPRGTGEAGTGPDAA